MSATIMKSFITKASAKNKTVKVIKGISCGLHITTQVATNLVTVIGNATCDKIANIEGFLVEKVDGTPKEETAGLRYEYTQRKMMQAGLKAQEYADKFTAFNEKVDDIMVDAIDKIKHAIVPEDSHPATLEFQLAEARSKRDKLINDDAMDKNEKSKLLNEFNKEIGRIKKDIAKNIPNISPDQAFAK